MAKGILYDPTSLTDDQPILIKRGDGVVTTQGTGTNTVTQGNSTVPIYIGGKYAGYEVKNLDPVRGVEVVVNDQGDTKWLPYNVNERLVPYLTSDGQLDLLGAVQGGITDQIDYAGWNVSQKELDDTIAVSKYIRDGGFYAQEAYDDGVTLETIRTFASEFVPRQDQPTDNIPTNTDVRNEELKPFMTSSGGLDIFAAVANGITNLDAYKQFDVTQKDLDNIQSLLKYRQADGRVNVTQAIADGVDRDILNEYFDLTDVTVSETAGNVITTEDVKVAEETKPEKKGKTAVTVTGAGIVSAESNKAKALQKLKGYQGKAGKVDVREAVKGLSDKELQDAGISLNTTRLAKIANQYSKEDGTFDTIAAVKGNVSDADLKKLGLSEKNIQDAKDIITMEKYGIDPSNYTLTDAIQKGVPDDVLYRWNDKASVDSAKQFIDLEKYFVDGKTNIDTALSLGASEEQLKGLGFSDDEIKQYNVYQELSKNGYLLNDNELNVRKMYDDGRLDLLLDAAPEISQSDISKIKAEYADLDKNYVALGTGDYIPKSELQNINRQLDQLVTEKEKSSILSNLLQTGDFDTYNSKVQSIIDDRISSIYVTNGDQILDYNYSGISELQKTGKLDSTLSFLGVDDVAAWRQEYDDAKYINDYVRSKNSLQNRPNGTIDDYIYEAPQAVLDRVNRVYGTDYQHGKYAELYDRLSGLTLSEQYKLQKELLPELNNPFSTESLEFVTYISNRLGSNVTKNVKDWSSEQSALKALDNWTSSIDGEKILKKLGVSEEVQKKIQPMKWIKTAKNNLIVFQQDQEDLINNQLESEVARAIPKLGVEATINDLFLDGAIISLSLLESAGKAAKGNSAAAVTGAASVLMQVATYPLTLPEKWKKDPSQAFAETVSYIIPGPDVKGVFKSIGKAATTATFGKIADITKVVSAPIAGASTAKKTTVSVVFTDQKTAKTSTLPIATGKMQEVGVEVKGYRPADFGKVVSSGIVSDKAGNDVKYTRYQDEKGNITVQLYTGDKNKWDKAANELVWDTIQEVSHENKLATGTSPAVSVVYGNYKVTSSPDGAKMSFVKDDKVTTVQTSKNIAPYDYSNKYAVTNMGVQVDKKGKDAPSIVLNTMKVKDYASDSSGKITIENRKAKRTETVKTDQAKLDKLIAKDIAKSTAKVVGIVLEPRFTKSILADVKKVIDSKLPRTFQDNYKALQQLTFALQVMDPRDVAKVMKWAKRPEMKRLLDKGEYAKFVEIIGLDKVEVPRVWDKNWEEIYKDNTNPQSKAMSQVFLSKIRTDISRFQAAQTKRYQKTKKVKQAAGKAIIPVLLATRLALPASYGFDAGRVESGPRIEMVEGRLSKVDYGKMDKLDEKIEETKTDKKSDVKQDISLKFDETKLSDYTAKQNTKADTIKTKIDKTKTRTELSGPDVKSLGGSAPKVNVDEKIRISETLKTHKSDMREILSGEKAETVLKAETEQTKVNDTKQTKAETKADVKADTKDLTKEQFQETIKEQVDQDVKANVKEMVQKQVVDVRQNLFDQTKIDTTQKINKKINIKNPRLNLKPPKIRKGSEKGKTKTIEEKKGPITVAWRQGSLKIKGRTKPVWIVVRKQGNQLVKSYEYKTPEGAPVTKGKAYQTLFSRGKKIRPFRVKVGFSNVTVDLSKSGKDRIRYEKTKYKLPTQRQISRSRF